MLGTFPERAGAARASRRAFLKGVLASAAALGAGPVLLHGAAGATGKGGGRGKAPDNSSVLRYRDDFLRALVKAAPPLLKTYDASTGRFGSGIWICQDQNLMLPLAVLYATPGRDNRYYKDGQLLSVIMKAGDALIEDMDERGQWEFRKKDGSTWGKISMPWTYSRWIRSYALIREDMPADRRMRWTEAFDRGFSHIERTQLGRPHNIPAHQAMALYVAGQQLERPAWRARAAQFLQRVAAAQCEGGYWAEGEGPLVRYNFVYGDALGVYYKLSADTEVMPAIERAIRFHRHFTYPSGQAVETVDLRNPYAASVLPGDPSFTLTPEGRAWLQSQWQKQGGSLSEDSLALFLLHGEEGPVAETGSARANGWFVLREKGVERAATLREGPWFICLSGYTAAVDPSRWHQDRQNLVSIWHEKTGLILGGGNTKLQPAWSNFTVGRMELLQHRPGDTQPDFLPRGQLYHVPSEARLLREPEAGLDLTYGPETCQLRVRPRNERRLDYSVEATTRSGLPVLAHLTLLPRLGEEIETAQGKKARLSESPLTLSGSELGGGLSYGRFRLRLPKAATLHWPALPHDPYRKDGRATPSQGRVEVRLPLERGRSAATITVEILA